MISYCDLICVFLMASNIYQVPLHVLYLCSNEISCDFSLLLTFENSLCILTVRSLPEMWFTNFVFSLWLTISSLQSKKNNF